MNTCGTCKHFGDPVESLLDWDSSNDGSPIESPYHVCKLLNHLNKRRAPYPTTDPAGVIDGSGYRAVLCVKEEFGCNQWAAK